MNVKTPINVDEFVSSLGVIEFFRKFICNFAEKCSCLFHLLKKGRTFSWSHIRNTSFI